MKKRRHFTENTESWFADGDELATRAAAGEVEEELDDGCFEPSWWRTDHRVRVLFVTGAVVATAWAALLLL